MTTSPHRKSAKIYQFPIRVRPPAGGRHDAANRDVDPMLVPHAAAVCGSGWYHEAAIEEAVRTVKR